MAFPVGWSGYWTITCDYTKTPAKPGVLYVALSDAPEEWWDVLDAISDTDLETVRVSTTSDVLVPAYVARGVLANRAGTLLVQGAALSTSTNVTLRVWVGGSASAPAVTDPEGRNAALNYYRSFHFPGDSNVDITGNGFTLSPQNLPGTAASPLEEIDAASLNGSNQAFHLSNPISGWPMTVESLAYTTSDSVASTIFSLGNSASGASQNIAVLRLRGDSLDRLYFAVDGNSGSTANAQTSTTYSINTWHHCVGVHDTDNDETHAYLDAGGKGTSGTIVTGPSFNQATIGAYRYSASVNFFLGNIAMVATTERVESDNWVTAMRNVWTKNVYTSGSWTSTGAADLEMTVDFDSPEVVTVDGDVSFVGLLDVTVAVPFIESGVLGALAFLTLIAITVSATPANTDTPSAEVSFFYTTGEIPLSGSSGSPVVTTSGGGIEWLAVAPWRQTQVGLYDGATTKFLEIKNPAPTFPAGAELLGVRVEVSRGTTDDDEFIGDSSIRLIVGGTAVGDNKATSGSWFDTSGEYGGVFDKWGVADLSITDVTPSTFGVQIQATKDGVTDVDGKAEVSSIRFEFYYQIGEVVAVTRKFLPFYN